MIPKSGNRFSEKIMRNEKRKKARMYRNPPLTGKPIRLVNLVDGKVRPSDKGGTASGQSGLGTGLGENRRGEGRDKGTRGGAAHLPGMTAAMTLLPVFGVPVESKALSGLDSLYSIVQMPPGVPVGTLAIGRAGAINAALLAASVLALADGELAKRLEAWRQRQTEAVPETPEDGKS